MNTEICTNIENLYCSSIYPNCPKKNLCDSGQYKFSKEPKMPYIGRDYGNNPKIPNLLFISLDSGDEIENLHTIEENRKDVEENPPRKKPGKDLIKHWYQTFDLAKILLDKYLDDSIKKGESYADSFFAHTNSAKCTQNKESRKEADANVFENCRDFVLKEIPLFNADIIITQGICAQDCLNAYNKSETIVLETTRIDKDVKLFIYIKIINNKNILHIPMYHPRDPRYWGHKQAFTENIDKIVEIVEKVKE